MWQRTPDMLDFARELLCFLVNISDSDKDFCAFFAGVHFVRARRREEWLAMNEPSTRPVRVWLPRKNILTTEMALWCTRPWTVLMTQRRHQACTGCIPLFQRGRGMILFEGHWCYIVQLQPSSITTVRPYICKNSRSRCAHVHHMKDALRCNTKLGRIARTCNIKWLIWTSLWLWSTRRQCSASIDNKSEMSVHIDWSLFGDKINTWCQLESNEIWRQLTSNECAVDDSVPQSEDSCF